MANNSLSFSLFFKFIFLGCLINLGFFLIDLFWLNALPIYNLSYGPVRPALFGFTFLRTGFFFVWLFILVGICLQGKRNIQKSCHWLLVIPNILLLGLGIYGAYIEPFQLAVSQVEISVKGLEHPVRIVQLSDTHVERTTPRERALPQLVESLEPDIIVITGDFINESYTNDPLTRDALRDVVGQLRAKYGVYGVNGNVETPKMLRRLLDGLDIVLLDDEVIRIPAIGENFVIVGLSYEEWVDDIETLAYLMTQVSPGDFSLLLYHKPDLAYAARDQRVDLFLAGHTHGGQVRLPFYGALITNSMYGKTFEMGLYQLSETTMFVSRGLGFTGGVAPRIRFLAPPEVVTIDLIPEK
jgi:predicted MPP superfamily phosphohydrolase